MLCNLSEVGRRKPDDQEPDGRRQEADSRKQTVRKGFSLLKSGRQKGTRSIGSLSSLL
jgi:hypothetical protein